MVFVDGLRTAFGRAGPEGMFWRTRADDMAVKVARELLRRNPQPPPERVGDVVMAATAQVGDQGLTLGRDVAQVAGLPHTVPKFAAVRGNTAGLTDGASACILASEEAVAELGLAPRMRLVFFAYAGVEPELMGLGPVGVGAAVPWESLEAGARA